MAETPLITELLSQLWFRFALVTLLGFLTGLEIHEYIRYRSLEAGGSPHPRIGGARTYAFIAMIGYVFYLLDPGLRLYLVGLGGLFLFFGLFYFDKLKSGQLGILQPLIALIVYSYGPTLGGQPAWFLVFLFVATIFILNARPFTHRLTEIVDPHELLTLSKFLLLAAVILPLMPDQAVSPWLPTTPFKIWVAVVAISAISYLGYILQRYLFPHQGYLVTGLLGGLYSSTATTIVLARRVKIEPGNAQQIGLAMLGASGMMYLRLLVLVALLNHNFLAPTAIPFLLMGAGTILFAALRSRHTQAATQARTEAASRNPLELGTALLFAVLFIVMLLLTRGVLHTFGEPGLQIFSLIAGFTDIDPFVLSLLKGQFHLASLDQLAAAMIIATGSNNFLKAFYAVVIAGWKVQKMAVSGLVLLGVATMGYGLSLTAL